MTFPLTLTFMFLVLWRPQEWLLPWLYGWPLLDGVIYMALVSLTIELNQGQARLPKTPAIMLIVGLWIATALSHLPHTYFQGIVNTLSDAFRYCFFTTLLLAIVDRLTRLRLVFIVFMIGSAVMAVHCLMQERIGYGFAGVPPLWQYRPKEDIWVTRSFFFGIFGDPNDTAQFLAAAVPLVFAVPRRLNAISFIWASSVAFLLLLGLFSTHSRGGEVALITTLVAIAFLVLPTRWLPHLAVAGLATGLVLCRFKAGALLDMSARERVEFWGLANRAFKDNPLFGLGYGMFWEVAGDRAAHNAFVTCYTEIGLVGYWFWFSLLQLGIVGAWRARMALRGARTLGQIYLRRAAGLCIVSLVGFCAGAYFLSRAFIFPLFFLLALVNVIPLLAQRMLPEHHPRLINVGRDVFGWGTVATFFSVAYIYVTILLLNKVLYR